MIYLLVQPSSLQKAQDAPPLGFQSPKLGHDHLLCIAIWVQILCRAAEAIFVGSHMTLKAGLPWCWCVSLSDSESISGSQRLPLRFRQGLLVLPKCHPEKSSASEQ